MAIVQCAFGHFYDDEKELFCPICSRQQSGATGDGGFDLQSQVTVSGFSIGKSSEGATEMLDGTEFQPEQFDLSPEYDIMQDPNATVGFFDLQGVGSYTAGWLVCTAGSNRGESYAIRLGRNFGGSAPGNDIVLSEKDVADIGHFSVIYDPKKNQFHLVPENGAVFLNGEFIANPEPLKADDEIDVGSAHLIFVPFCNEHRTWEV